MGEIRVHVIQEGDRPNLSMRYKDPTTGLHVKRTTGTPNRREAERRARQWEAELNAGTAARPSSTTWATFRRAYEDQALTSLAVATQRKVRGVFNFLEDCLPAVRNGKLAELTAQRIAYVQSELRKAGRAETTIKGHLAHWGAALQWAVDIGMLSAVPKIKRPHRAKRARSGEPMKGRPITPQEFQALLGAAEGVVGADAAPSWRYYLRGLWWGGLRLAESMELYWDRRDRLCIDLSSKRPLMWIPAELEKGNQDRLLPLAPEFASLLLQTPKGQRYGPVFNPVCRRGPKRLCPERVGRVVCAIGKAAGIVVRTHPKTGKAKYASCHDLRRSFGERWALRVRPHVLMLLMRHENIQTTLRYYVGRDAMSAAEAVWQAYDSEGTIQGTASDFAVGLAESLDAEPLTRQGVTESNG